MTNITYEDKMRYLDKSKGVIQGHIAMIQKLHPKGDFRLEELQKKLDLIESIIKDVKKYEKILKYVIEIK